MAKRSTAMLRADVDNIPAPGGLRNKGATRATGVLARTAWWYDRNVTLSTSKGTAGY